VDIKDLTILKPVERTTIIFGDPPVSYKILSIVDLTYTQMVDFMESGDLDAVNKMSLPEYMLRMRKQIKTIAPSMDDGVLNAMTFRNLTDFVNAAMVTAQKDDDGNPQSATAGAGSASSTS